MAKKPPLKVTKLVTSKVILGDQKVSISRLHLDPINPRHDPLESDSEVVAQLCATEKVAALGSVNTNSNRGDCD